MTSVDEQPEAGRVAGEEAAQPGEGGNTPDHEQPEEREPPSDDEAAQDDYANTDRDR